MSQRKPFNTTAFLELSDAIHKMHRTLKEIRTIFNRHKDIATTQQEIATQCADQMERAIAKAGFYGEQWLSEIRTIQKNLP
jgi:hypothetical protein